MLLARIDKLIRGLLSLCISGLEKRHPEALLEVEKENLRKQIARYNDGLASHAGLCERLMSQIKKLEAEERELKARTTANLAAGHRSVAAQYALRLQTVVRELDENRTQIRHAEETYGNLLRARDFVIGAARARIDTLKQTISDLKIKKAMAEMTEMASAMVTSLGGANDTLDRVQTMLEEERQKAVGRVRVAKDTLDTGDIEIKESEQRALAEQALADFAVQEGITLQPAIVKALGPGVRADE